MSTTDSPPDDITFRPADAPTPKFADLPLPPVLRELRGPANTCPSDMTALAIRLRGIRIDRSPNASPQTPPKGGQSSPDVAPMKLDFSPHPSTSDKENIPTPESCENLSDTPTPSGKRRPRSRPFGEMIATAEPVSIPLPEVDDSVEAHANADTSESNLQTELSMPIVSGGMESRLPITTHPGLDIAETSTLLKVSWTAETQSFSSAANVTAPISGADFTIDAPPPPTTMNDEKIAHGEDILSQTLYNSTNDSMPANQPVASSSPSEAISVNSASVADEVATKEASTSHAHPPQDVSRPPLLGTPDKVEDASSSSSAEVERVRQQLQMVIEGKQKWSWPERCEALKDLTLSLEGELSPEVAAHINHALPTLSSKVNDHLDELRPSIISAALKLFDAIVSSKLNAKNFIEDVFPSVMDLSSGRSLAAHDAAGSMSLALEVYPDLASILPDADDPKRIGQVLEDVINKDGVFAEAHARAQRALELVKSAHPSEFSPPLVAPKPPMHTSHTEPIQIEVSEGKSSTIHNIDDFDSKQVALKKPPSVPQRKEDGKHVHLNVPLPSPGSRKAKSTSPSPKSSSPTMSPASSSLRIIPEEGSSSLKRSVSENPTNARVLSARVSSRLSWRAKLQTPGLISGHGFPVTNDSNTATSIESYSTIVDAQPATPSMENKRLSNTIQRISPSSARKLRMYTEEDLEEVRKAAMRVCMEEASHGEAKEREKLLKEKQDLEASLKRERADNKELQNVLTEFEMTMQKMVSQSNSQASLQQSALETEKNKLKADLLEVSESFEKLKEKYETAKQTIVLLENKETRLIEQVKDLKTNMVELQKWSNDLKANAEKKLAKSFEAVTTYRASYMDKEAHAQKAISDLERTKAELEKTVANHAETAATVSRLEEELHRQQDAKSEFEGQLASSKASLSRVTVSRDRLQKEVESSQKELGVAKARVTELQGAAVRMREAQKQVETMSSENQSLKARAYDDMTRIRKLEGDLDDKERELDELNKICEEAMTQLEEAKLGEKM